MRRISLFASGSLLGALLAGAGVRAESPGRAPAVGVSPLSGIVSAGGLPVPGATLLVRFSAGGIESPVQILKSEPDGTFVLSNARAGVYTVLSLVPGFRPAVARILHQAGGAVSFVRLELERPGVLPSSPLGAADPWNARAVVAGDVLRDMPAILGALSDPPAGSQPAPAIASAGHLEHGAMVPVRASVSSMTGFGAMGGANVSRASLDVAGTMGESLRWGVGGRYSRLGGPDGVSGDASQFALDIASGGSQSLHLATRRQSIPIDEVEGSRFSAHSVDWSGATSESSRASVSARLISQTRLLKTGPVADLFARESDSLDVVARYRTDFDAGRYVRFNVGYRSDTAGDAGSVISSGGRETRVGGAGGIRLFEVLVLEGGATGDFSTRARGVTPELTVALESRDGWKLYGFASRRYERRPEDGLPWGLAGTDEADLTHLSRSLYRGGVLYRNTEGESFSIEASRRELAGTYRYLLDPDFLDRLDSLYFLSGDVATEISSTGTWRIRSGLDGRLSARAGRIVGMRDGTVQEDEASYGIAEAAVRIGVTRTSLGVGYRVVTQTLSRSGSLLHNDVSSLDFSLAQALPVPLLRALDSEWRALLSLELGKRREGEDEEKANRRLAGGLAVSF